MCRVTAELPAGSTQQVLQPLPRPPARHSQRLAVPASAHPPALLVVDVEGASGLNRLLAPGAAGGGAADNGRVSAPELAVNLVLRGDDMGSVTTAADSWGVRLARAPSSYIHDQPTIERPVQRAAMAIFGCTLAAPVRSAPSLYDL